MGVAGVPGGERPERRGAGSRTPAEMVAVFDFPERAPDVEHVPLLAVDYVTGDRSAAARA